MLQTVAQRFQGSCMMLMRKWNKEVTFLGSSFLVHPDGYLLTTARITQGNEGLVVVPPDADTGFVPATREQVSPVPVEVVDRDMTRDVALLKLKPDLDINMPEAVLGQSENDPQGSPLLSLGAPFGYYRIHSVLATESILSGRLKSHGGTNLIVFDRRVQYGDIGGPLVSINDAQVIGVVGGVFDPLELDGREPPEGVNPINSDLSYATSIEYGAALLDRQLKKQA